ncbi:zinc-binding dehydrogenase [Citricoccus sp. NPDC055426]|uniref:zinc-binding dehydrogenase n=1 Tax=Citricoccus sp. NPDC055426 TaxID=3155536 RepID=UPI003412D07A
MKIRGAVFEAKDKPLTVEELEMDETPGPGNVLVRYKASGICGTDLHKSRNLDIPPHLLGHEGAGVVEAVGSGIDDLKVGDKVIMSFRSSCGNCFYCLRGQNPQCEWGGGPARTILRQKRYRRADGTMLDADLGTFGEAANVPRQYVVKVESDLPFEQLALVGCGVTTGFGAAVNTAGIRTGSTVAVIGCGGVGQSAIQGARIAGASMIIAIDTVQSKLDYAIKNGATHTVLVADSVDTVAEVKALTAGRGADFALEVTGFAENVVKGYEMVRRRGIVVAVGIKAAQVTLPIHEMILEEKRLYGSLYGSSQVPVEFQRIIDFAERGDIDLGAMVSNVIGLDEVNEGLDAMAEGKVIRSVISYG